MGLEEAKEMVEAVAYSFPKQLPVSVFDETEFLDQHKSPTLYKTLFWTWRGLGSNWPLIPLHKKNSLPTSVSAWYWTWRRRNLGRQELSSTALNSWIDIIPQLWDHPTTIPLSKDSK